jgi:fatty acid desaturase
MAPQKPSSPLHLSGDSSSILPVWTKSDLDRSRQGGKGEEGGRFLVFDGHVCDVSKWIHKHPGGKLVMQHMLNKDATDQITLFHERKVLQTLVPSFYVAKYDTKEDPHQKSEVQRELLKEFRSLHQELLAKGLYEPDLAFYKNEWLKGFLLWLCSIYLCLFLQTPLATFGAAFLLATCWHQLAFVAHDAGHNSVFRRSASNHWLGVFLGNMIGGISIGWWKHSHNVHHIVTNHPEHDPDIQHLPFFAVTSKFFQNLYSTYHKKVLVFNGIAAFFIRYQHLTYYPLLMVGRANLYANSWIHLFRRDELVPFRFAEISGLLCFMSWYSYVLYMQPNLFSIAVLVIISHSLSALLHAQITLSHFMMPTETASQQQKQQQRQQQTSADSPLVLAGDGVSSLEEEEEYEKETFPEQQLRTTLDVDCPRWLDWLHGGLQFQVIHHLFPRLPRSRLRSLQPRVDQLAKKYGLSYQHYTFTTASLLTIHHLKSVGLEIHSTPTTTTNNQQQKTKKQD